MRLLLILALGLTSVASLRAADAPPTSPVPREIQIAADRFEYDATGELARYEGHVRVEDPQMTLECERLTVRLSAGGGGIQSILAEQKVVIVHRQDQSRGTGDTATYSAESNIVELTGNPVLEMTQGTLTGDRVVFDRAKNRLLARGNVRMKIRPEAMKQSTLLAPRATNAPAAK